MNDDIAQVRTAVERNLGGLADDAPVVVAVSGGPDSLALARAVALGRRPATAVIIDHGLQQDSSTVAEHAASQCHSFGLADVRIVRVEVPQGPGTGGLEAAARHVRRAALLDVANSLGAPAILLGHTRDDQAETVLLRLARGSGARSLAAMAPVAGIWRRPLLGVSRDVVRRSVADLATWNDPHNDDERFARVRVRRSALPALSEALGPAVIDGLARSADLLRDDADALDDWAARSTAQCQDADGALDIDELARLPRAVRTRIMRAAALAAGSSPTDLTAAHIDRIDELMTRWRGQGPIDLPGGIAARRECGRLSFVRVPPVAERRQSNEET